MRFSSRNDVLVPGTVFECRLRLGAASLHQYSEANAAGEGLWSTDCVSPCVYGDLPKGPYSDFTTSCSRSDISPVYETRVKDVPEALIGGCCCPRHALDV